MKAKWIREAPQAPGWYWYRDSEDKTPRPYKVTEVNCLITCYTLVDREWLVPAMEVPQ